MNVLFIISGDSAHPSARKVLRSRFEWSIDTLRRSAALLPRGVLRKVLGGFGTTEKRFPMGVGYLSAMLKQAGHSVRLLDRFADPGRWIDTAANFDVIGIYGSTPCFDDTLTIINRLEAEKFPGRIAVGGPHASAFPDTIPSRVDYIVQGEGEYIINDLVQGAYARGSILRTQRIVNLDALPRADYELFLDEPRSYQRTFDFCAAEPVFVMNTSRSCPLPCDFCSVKDIWGRMWRGQSAQRVLDDILYLKKRFGIAGVYFREDNFASPRSRLVKICESLIRENVNIVWACEARVDTTCDEETTRLMARSGCRGFYIGAESGSQRMLDFYKKGTTVDQIVKTCEYAKKYGIAVAMSTIVAHPRETWKDRWATFDLIRKTKPEIVFASPYRDEYSRHGKVKYPVYPGRARIDVEYENGTWAGQKDRGISAH